MASLQWMEPTLLAPPASNAPPAPREARTPPRPSQQVHESNPALTRGMQHVVIVLERKSTGGTRRKAQFKKSKGGPMTGAERKKKERARASLFPQQQIAARARHAEQERLAQPRRKEKADIEQQSECDRLNAELDAEIFATGGYITCEGKFQPVCPIARRERLRVAHSELEAAPAAPECSHTAAPAVEDDEDEWSEWVYA